MEQSHLKVLTKTQQLQLISKQTIIKQYNISTALNGLGEVKNSGKTPRGWHIVRAKIGATLPINTVFVGRRPTGEIYSKQLAKQYPARDWILTRIIWLSGLELGKNRLGNVDTMQRFIYIHGCPDEYVLGTPLSNGCIRLRNKDIIELFEMINVGIKIYIEDMTT